MLGDLSAEPEILSQKQKKEQIISSIAFLRIKLCKAPNSHLRRALSRAEAAV
jgi:hypothetical protein